MTEVTIHQAKTNLSRLIAAVERGEEVVIKRGSKPVVRLSPFEAQPTPVPTDQPGWRRRPDGSIELLYTGTRPGTLKGLFTVPESFFEPMSEEELADWEDSPIFPE